MRRFHQVAIVAVAMLSLIAFLVYKHEYERLRNILEVLNTFGNSAGATGQSPSSNAGAAGFRKSDGRLPGSDVSVNWRQLDDGVHIVSTAFWIRGHSIVVHGVIRGRRRHIDVPWTRCHVRLDSASSSSFKTTESTLEVDGQTPDVWLSFTLVCKYSELALPVAVSFSEEGSSSLTGTPTINVYQTTNLSLPAHDVVICAAAIFDSTSAAKSTDEYESLAVQFLEYHRHVGISRVLIYADNLLPAVRRRIQIMASSVAVGGLVVRLVDWNAPVSSDDDSIDAATSIVMKRDCAARLRSSSSAGGYVAFLELHELLVSRYHSRLSNFVKDEANVVDDKLGGLRLTRRIFCVEFDDGPNALPETESLVFRYKNDLALTPPMFTKTRWVSEELLPRSITAAASVRNVTYLLEIGSALKTFRSDGVLIPDAGRSFPKVNDEFACVHAYIRCGAGYKRLIDHANSEDVVIKRIHDQFL